MKRSTRNAVRGLAAAISITFILPANAMLPVVDIPNFVVNVINKHTLFDIRHQLQSADEGTVVYNTINIDKSTSNIDTSTSISADIDIKNYDIDADFTWIINPGQGEIIPIPRNIMSRLDAILGDQTAETFSSHFKTATHYAALPSVSHDVRSTMEGSRARKAANDALVLAVEAEKHVLDADVNALRTLADAGNEAKGHGRQLQVANAYAGAQANQMVKLRTMMLVAEASRAAEAQASADKDSREIAVRNHLRKGLDQAVSQSVTPHATY